MVGTRLAKPVHTWSFTCGFGVTFNDVTTKDAAFYTTTSGFVAWLGAVTQERTEV
jgi:hypothetical protein